MVKKRQKKYYFAATTVSPFDQALRRMSAGRSIWQVRCTIFEFPELNFQGVKILASQVLCWRTNRDEACEMDERQG